MVLTVFSLLPFAYDPLYDPHFPVWPAFPPSATSRRARAPNTLSPRGLHLLQRCGWAAFLSFGLARGWRRIWAWGSGVQLVGYYLIALVITLILTSFWGITLIPPFRPWPVSQALDTPGGFQRAEQVADHVAADTRTAPLQVCNSKFAQGINSVFDHRGFCAFRGLDLSQALLEFFGGLGSAGNFVRALRSSVPCFPRSAAPG